MADLVARGLVRLDVPADATVVLAVSGGADSMALLHGAAHARQLGSSRWAFSVAHLDHALRDGSADDARFVADAAAVLGLPFESRRIDVRALAAATGSSVEEAGREARYAFLGEVAGAAGWIATAHTADDAAETVLINLVRGSGLAGARGIPARRGRIVRPLLGERRAELRAMLEAADIAYRDDPTNADPAYLRNAVRQRLLPLVEELRSGAVEAIARFARLAADDDELLDRLAADELDRRRAADGTIDWHEPPPTALGRRILRLAIGDPAPAAERIDALLEAGAGDRGGLTLELGGGRSASVRGRRIRLE